MRPSQRSPPARFTVRHDREHRRSNAVVDVVSETWIAPPRDPRTQVPAAAIDEPRCPDQSGTRHAPGLETDPYEVAKRETLNGPTVAVRDNNHDRNQSAKGELVTVSEQNEQKKRDRRTEPIAEGISREIATGRFRVSWTPGPNQKRKEQGYPADTPIAVMVAFRALQIANANEVKAAGPTTGSFPRDVVRFLRTRKHRPCYKSDRSHMKRWVEVFGRLSRHVINNERISLTLARPDWQKSPKEIRHRIGILKRFFHFHNYNGKPGPTPCDYVELPKPIKRAPKGVPDATIAKVAANLLRQEQLGRLRDGSTRARYLVLATTMKRPCQVRRTNPDDVNFETRIWDVPDAKNAPGGPMYLNDEMLAAWKLFRDAECWSPEGKKYNHDSFCKTLRRNGWPGGKGGTRPYAMRHQGLQTMDEMEINPRAIQAAGDHTSFETTERFYLGKTKLRESKFAAEVIDGRFGSALFAKREPKDYDKKHAKDDKDDKPISA
jgi:integrase